MKGFVSFIELVVAIIILIVAFAILFPPFRYTTKWGEALALIKGRDIVSSLASSNKMYEYSFNSSLAEEFLSQALRETNFIYSYSTTNAVKNEIFIACNCTLEEINELSKLLSGFEINGREIEFLIFYSRLDEINDPNKRSDLLLILGNKELDEYYGEIKKYLESGKGIILVADFSDQLSGEIYEKIFGLNSSGGIQIDETLLYDIFRKKPTSAKEINYEPWKYFYHVSIPIFTSPYFGDIPLDPNLQQENCISFNGSLNLKAYLINENALPYSFKFWTCNDSKIFIDSDLNGKADKEIFLGQQFSLTMNSISYNFSLNYIRKGKVGISIKPEYDFFDFIKYEWDYQAGFSKYNLILPVDGNYERVLIKLKDESFEIAGCILNSSTGKTAWVSDFRKEGITDDERLLLASLIFSVSNKNPTQLYPRMKIGYTTSYLNVENKDVYEIYEFQLTLGYPF